MSQGSGIRGFKAHTPTDLWQPAVWCFPGWKDAAFSSYLLTSDGEQRWLRETIQSTQCLTCVSISGATQDLSCSLSFSSEDTAWERFMPLSSLSVDPSRIRSRWSREVCWKPSTGRARIPAGSAKGRASWAINLPFSRHRGLSREIDWRRD